MNGEGDTGQKTQELVPGEPTTATVVSFLHIDLTCSPIPCFR